MRQTTDEVHAQSGNATQIRGERSGGSNPRGYSRPASSAPHYVQARSDIRATSSESGAWFAEKLTMPLVDLDPTDRLPTYSHIASSGGLDPYYAGRVSDEQRCLDGCRALAP